MDKLSLKIVTPEKVVFEKDGLDSVTIPTADGEITILPHHIPVISQLSSGEMVIRCNKEENSLIITSGFLKLDSAGKILLLTDYAIRSEDIEITKVEEAKKKAEESMKNNLSRREFLIAEAELRKTLLELRVAQKRRRFPKI